MKRIDKENYYLDIAETVLERSTCLRRCYGAIIVKNDEIVSTGYNGAPRGRRNCMDLGYCAREAMQVPSGERYELCRSVHAEMNAIISAARRDTLGATLYLAGREAKSGELLHDATSCSMCRRVIINAGIDRKRETLFDDYLNAKYSHFQMRSLDDYERLKKVNLARSNTQSKFVRKSLMDNVREHSNGESALLYFEEKIQDNGLYLLDEPENSLSPEKQQELLKFLEESMRFYGCQFIIATHSPFLLSMKGAKIYDLDEEPVDVKRWYELENVRAYYEFFKKHEGEFI